MLQKPAQARVLISVDLSSQQMQVQSASGAYVWPISSARSGFRTPHGQFRVQRMEAMHRSRKYHNSAMPHSLFFSGGYAIHGTYAERSLGRPASHGCIRISRGNAAALYAMVKAEGGSISITGTAPVTDHRYASRTRTFAKALHRTVHGYAARAGFFDDGAPFGYAPQRRHSFEDWWADPGQF